MIRHSVSTRLTRLFLALALLAVPVYLIGAAHGDDGNPLSPAASFAGKFANDKLSVELSESGGTYVGTFTKGGNQFPAKASLAAQALAGTFTAAGTDYAFTATLVDDQLVLVSSGKSYTLARVGANPLDPGVPPQQTPAAPAEAASAPADGAAADSDAAFGAFSVLGSTPKGKTLFLKLPGGQTIEAAITQTADELGKVLDGKPAITGAFADSKGKTRGGATFAGTLKGQDMHGTIFAGTGVVFGSANVILATADASNDDMKELMGFMPAPIKMTTHKFPDGSGSVDLPEGWTTPTQSAIDGVVVIGPAGQTVVRGNHRLIRTPDCLGVRMGRQTYQMKLQTYSMMMQQYQQSGRRGNPPHPPVPPNPDPNAAAVEHNSPTRYCEYCDGPEEFLKVWYPLMEDIGKSTGTPYVSLDKIILLLPDPVNPDRPKTKSGVVYLAVTDHDGDKATKFRALNKITTINQQPGEAWLLWMCVMRAPDETFDKDLPVMRAIMHSIYIDDQVVSGEMKAIGDASLQQQKEAFETLEKSHAVWQDQQARQFADHEQQIGAQEQAMHDSSSDFIEYIGGTRDVYDNATGQTHQVDLFHSDAIIGAENTLANDPNRFVQIPLRYER